MGFVALLRSGVIHTICNQVSKATAMHDLMLILCYLFGRRRLPRSGLNQENLRLLVRRYPSMIVLPPLPSAAINVLEEHDRLILRVYTGYAWTYASQNMQQLGQDNTLPLSGLHVTSSSPLESEFCQRLRSTASTITVRSGFVATSGHTDAFASVGELCRESRRGMHMNEHAIPSMEAILSHGDSPFKLNAYLLDFYTHGQLDTLVRANGIRRGDVWYLLQDFVLTLQTIKVSLQELLVKASNHHTPTENEDETLSLEIGEDKDDDDEENDYDEFSRPEGVDDSDWKVYEVFSDLARDYNVKFDRIGA